MIDNEDAITFGFSPDGLRLAFTKGSALRDLWTRVADASQPAVPINPPLAAGNIPSWTFSPDSSELTFRIGDGFEPRFDLYGAPAAGKMHLFL